LDSSSEAANPSALGIGDSLGEIGV
jgi:hypothetical protein